MELSKIKKEASLCISSLRKETLSRVEVTRLQSEFVLIWVRLSYAITKYPIHGKETSFASVLEKFAGLKRFLQKKGEEELKELTKRLNQSNEENEYTLKDHTRILQLTRTLFVECDLVWSMIQEGKEEPKPVCDSCFHFDMWKNEGIAIHFRNSVLPKHPLKGQELKKRRKELQSIAREIKENRKYETVKYVFSVSWMWNLEVFQKFMPKKFVTSLEEFKSNDFLSLGHYGQFYRYDGNVHESRVKEFMKEWKFPLPCLLGECPLEIFLEMYLND